MFRTRDMWVKWIHWWKLRMYYSSERDFRRTSAIAGVICEAHRLQGIAPPVLVRTQAIHHSSPGSASESNLSGSPGHSQHLSQLEICLSTGRFYPDSLAAVAPLASTRARHHYDGGHSGHRGYLVAGAIPYRRHLDHPFTLHLPTHIELAGYAWSF